MVRKAPGYGLFRARPNPLFRALFGGAAAVAAALQLAGCKAATTPLAPPPTGPDSAPPVVQLSPARDTSVDAAGTLLIAVRAHDQSWVTRVELVIEGGAYTFPAIQPDTTDVAAAFPIPLAELAHTSFRWFVRARDILDHETVTDTVTVNVR